MTRYYVHDGESYDASYTTPEEARHAAERALDGWRDDAERNDGCWADEAASVAWGEVREIATLIPHAGAVEEDGLDDRGVDYELRAPDEDMVRAALTTPEAYVGAMNDAVVEELERLRADLAALRIEHDAWGAIIDATREDRDEARRERDDHARFLYAAGYTPCNSEACNCGSWHGGHVEELRARLRHVTQMLVGAVGAGGPMSAEAAAEKAVATIMERDELRAALLNERGEGEPPSEGWAWAPRESTDMVGRVLCRYYAWLKGPEDRGFEVLREPDGRWSVALETDQISYYPTAREAMKAADAALAGGKS